MIIIIINITDKDSPITSKRFQRFNAVSGGKSSNPDLDLDFCPTSVLAIICPFVLSESFFFFFSLILSRPPYQLAASQARKTGGRERKKPPPHWISTLSPEAQANKHGATMAPQQEVRERVRVCVFFKMAGCERKEEKKASTFSPLLMLFNGPPCWKVPVEC